MSNSILDWFTLTKTGEKGPWKTFYQTFLHRPISQPDRFFDGVDLLGHKVMFEAVIAASTKTFTEDCLNYVMAIAVKMVQSDLQTIDEEARYKLALEKAKQRTQMQNEEMEAKIERLRNG